jgi:hypothetical protein
MLTQCDILFIGELNMIKKIEKTLLNGTSQQLKDGLNWYERLNDYCSELANTFDMPVYKVAAIMSILSPQCSFTTNVRDTFVLLQDGKDAKLRSPIFKEKALKALYANSFDEVSALFNEKTAPKTLSFFENLLLLDSNRVTVDIHMIRFFEIEGSLTIKRYKQCEKYIQDYAEMVGLKPFQVQAQLWCIVRGKSF